MYVTKGVAVASYKDKSRCWFDPNHRRLDLKGMSVVHIHESPKVIRFFESANHQERNVRWFREYLDLERESSETIRRTPEMAKT